MAINYVSCNLFNTSYPCPCKQNSWNIDNLVKDRYNHTIYFSNRLFIGKQVYTNSRRRAFARNVDFSFIVLGSERTFTFRVSNNCMSALSWLIMQTVA